MADKYWEFKQDGVTYNFYDLPKGFVLTGSIRFSGKDLTELPDLSEVIIEGYFDCSDNKLTSLKGAPKKVGGNFLCFGNNLTSLEGAPQEVGGSFLCSDNRLESLEGAPQKVGGYFDCTNNRLTTLKGAPQKVGNDFMCSYNQLTSLFKLPQIKKGIIICDDALGQEYGFSDSLNSGIKPEDLLESSRYQNEAKIDDLRQLSQLKEKTMQENAPKIAKTQAAFEAWLKNNGKDAPTK